LDLPFFSSLLAISNNFFALAMSSSVDSKGFGVLSQGSGHILEGFRHSVLIFRQI
jgi:ABC-type uncharacterized transport system permease subunit